MVRVRDFIIDQILNNWKVLFSGIGALAIAGVVKYVLYRRRSRGEAEALKTIAERLIGIHQEESLVLKFELFGTREQIKQIKDQQQNIHHRLRKIEKQSTN
ncbi:MAG: hypothetical protein WBC22_09060 [Sedimentisphaerales bacterium]